MRTPTDMTYIATLTQKHTQKQMHLYAENMYNAHQHYLRVIVWLRRYPKFDLYVSTPEFAFTQQRVRTPGSAPGPHCK